LSPIRKRAPLPSQGDSFRSIGGAAAAAASGPAGPAGGDGDDGAPVEKQKPNFNTTGLLAREANRVEGTNISLKYHEPPEARKPASTSHWSILIFKGEDHFGTVELWKRSCWLVGREAKVCDLVAEHPSVSGQHAVVQFRWVLQKKKRKPGHHEAWEEGEEGTQKGRVKPYVIDLESVNGTVLNGEPIEPSRYVELRSGDVLRFGQSEREYVVMLPPAES
jgi:smad nuclear-interacting protein 1